MKTSRCSIRLSLHVLCCAAVLLLAAGDSVFGELPDRESVRSHLASRTDKDILDGDVYRETQEPGWLYFIGDTSPPEGDGNDGIYRGAGTSVFVSRNGLVEILRDFSCSFSYSVGGVTDAEGEKWR